MHDVGFCIIILYNQVAADYKSHNPDNHSIQSHIAESNQKACTSNMTALKIL
jgi:hypothetical protein